MNCPTCGKKTKKIISDHYFNESGLNDVILKNITVYICDCGEYMPSIPQIEELLKQLSLYIINVDCFCLEENVRIFLRKELGVSNNIKSNWRTVSVNIPYENDYKSNIECYYDNDPTK